MPPPPPIQISNEQRDAAIANGLDATAAFAGGIVDESLAQVSPPLSGYDGFTPAIKTAITDGCKQFFAISARYWQPIGASFADPAPSHSFTSDTQLATLSVVTFIPRKVLITFNMSAYVDVANTKMEFYVTVNDSPLQVFPYYFNVDLDHRSMSSTWVTTLPTGTVTIAALARVASGSGTLILDPGDTVALSVIG